jgi:hypothetical protein
MKIYKINIKYFIYDAFCAHIIVANSEQEVREIAKNKCADEGKDVWDSAEIEECGEYTGKETEPFVLLSHFNAC